MSANNDPQTRELLQAILNAEDDEAGIAIIDLPEALREWVLLTALEGEGLIQFRRRRHVHIGGGLRRRLVLEAGYDDAELGKDRRKSVKALLAEALAEDVPNEIRHRVRLTYRGKALAAKQRGEAAKEAGPVAAVSEPVTTPGTKKPKRDRRPSTNALMIEAIMRNPDAKGWNSTQWSKGIKRAKSSIVDTDTWKELELLREEAKARKALDRRQKGRPKLNRTN